MPPIGGAAEFVEVQRGQISVSFVIKGERHIASSTPALDRGQLRRSKCLSAVGGVLNGRGLKSRNDLFRIAWVHRNRGLTGMDFRRRNCHDMAMRRRRQRRLCESDRGNEYRAR